jgi:periplasmic protein TonB
MAVQIINYMPDAVVHRGEPLESMRTLVPHRPVRSLFSRFSGRAWFAFGAVAIHALALAGFMTAQQVRHAIVDPEPIVASLIEAPTAPAERPPEYVPQTVTYALPTPQDVSFETESITPPPVVTSAISEPGLTTLAPPVVESVEYVRPPQPVYPSESTRRRERGTVLLRVLVDALGRPAQIQVERSSGFSRLDEAARTAVEKSLFRPYEMNGIAQPAQVLIPIEFTRRG